MYQTLKDLVEDRVVDVPIYNCYSLHIKNYHFCDWKVSGLNPFCGSCLWVRGQDTAPTLPMWM